MPQAKPQTVSLCCTIGASHLANVETKQERRMKLLQIRLLILPNMMEPEAINGVRTT